MRVFETQVPGSNPGRATKNVTVLIAFARSPLSFRIVVVHVDKNYI